MSVPAFVMNIFEPFTTQLAVAQLRARARRAGVGARVRLRQPERGELLAGRELRQPFLLLLLVAVEVDRHRPERRVRRDGDRDRRVDARQLLDRDRVRHGVGAGAAVLLRDRDAHQPELGHLRDELVREALLAVELLGDRRDARHGELAHRAGAGAPARRSARSSREARGELGDRGGRRSPCRRGRAGSRRASARRTRGRPCRRAPTAPSPANSWRNFGREHGPALAQESSCSSCPRTPSRRSGGSARAAGTATRGRRSARPQRRCGRATRRRSRRSRRRGRRARAPSRRSASRGRCTCVAPSRRAYQSASARTSRPSASVLLISIVLPFAARRMSPGRNASPPGRFSAAARTAIARTGSPSAAIAPMPCSAPAPPAMSPFMSSMLRGGLQRDPAGVEGDRLADEAEHDVGARRRRRLVAQARSGAARCGCRGRPRRARPCRACRARAGRAPPPSGARARARARCACSRERLRVQLVRRHVREVARAVRALGDERRALGRRAQLRRLEVRRRRCARSCFGALRSSCVFQRPGRVAAEDRSLDERARLVGERDRERLVEQPAERAADAGERVRRCSAGRAQRVEVDVVARPDAGGDDARRLELPVEWTTSASPRSPRSSPLASASSAAAELLVDDRPPSPEPSGLRRPGWRARRPATCPGSRDLDRAPPCAAMLSADFARRIPVNPEQGA